MLRVLFFRGGCEFEKGLENCNMLGDIRIVICLFLRLENCEKFIEESIIIVEYNIIDESISNKKEVYDCEEYIYERRSSRLESFRSYKLGKEDIEFFGIKDMVKVVIRFL